MTDYEITYITDSLLDEAGRGELDTAIDSKISDLAGVASFASPNLRRRLAYHINKKNTAFIRTLQIQLDPAKITEMHTLLKKNPGIIRFSILQTPRREDATAEVIDRYTRKNDGKTTTGQRPLGHKAAADGAPGKAGAPAKEVTMQDVEKGIEEALTAEVK